MTNTQPRRRSPSAKAILGLLLAIVAAGAFAVASSADSSPRSGELHVTKQCRDYHGLAGQHCTITSSNIPEIKVGSNVVYASAAGDPTPGQLNSDLVIDGPGNNTAYGHVVLDVSTGTGVIDHIGFRTTGLQEMIDHLKKHNIEFKERQVDDQGLYQLFLFDPNGVKIELNFANAEAKGRKPELSAKDLQPATN